MDSNNLGNMYENLEPEKDNDPGKKRKIRYIVFTIAIILVFLGIFYWIGTNDEYNIEDNQIVTVQTDHTKTPIASPTETVAEVKGNIIDESSTKKLVAKSSGNCNAMAPEDWSMISDGSGRGTDIYNTDQSVGAGWFIAPILYDLYGEPDQAIETIMQALGNDSYTFTNTGETVEGGFTMREFSATNQGRPIKGIGFYKKYPIDSYGYVLSYYQGATTVDKWDQDGATAVAVAISIRCTAEIVPTADDGFESSTSVSDTSDKSSLTNSWSEQAILGQETVHSPSTGDTYTVSTSSYSDTGIQGGDPGYYRTIDSNGTVERLEPGFGSY